MRHLLNNNHDDAIHYSKYVLKTSKTDEVNKTYWFPTPQNPDKGKEHTPIQTRILKELREPQNLEQLNPVDDINSQNQTLSNVDCKNFTKENEAKQAVEALLVDFRNIFGRRRFDIGIKTEFKLQLTPLNNKACRAFQSHLISNTTSPWN